jgi:Tfp pilus assembly protein PilX
MKTPTKLPPRRRPNGGFALVVVLSVLVPVVALAIAFLNRETTE